MFKVNFKLDLSASDFKDAFTPNLDAAMGVTMRQAARKAQDLATARLQSGLGHWLKAFKVDKISDGVWVLAIDGKLGAMMEEGFSGEEFKRLILNGNRAKHNRSEGKDYVDVPIPLAGQGPTSEKKLQAVSVTQFKSGADVIRSVTMSDWKRGGVIMKNKIVQNVKGIIRTREKESKNYQYMMIRRVTPETNWGSWKGAHILDMVELETFISKQFEINLQKLL